MESAIKILINIYTELSDKREKLVAELYKTKVSNNSHSSIQSQISAIENEMAEMYCEIMERE